MLSTLLRVGFTQADLEGPELTKMLDILSHSFEVEKGVLGFGITPMTLFTFKDSSTNANTSSFLRGGRR
jgi:hypothetical protein